MNPISADGRPNLCRFILLRNVQRNIFFKGTYLIPGREAAVAVVLVQIALPGEVGSKAVGEPQAKRHAIVAAADSQNLFSQRTVSNLVTERQLQSL